MRLVTCGVLAGLVAPAAAAPSWTDVPDLISSAQAPLDDTLRACVTGKLPKAISVILARVKTGTTASMPVYGVGGRGMTPEETCLTRAVAKLAFPALPAEIDQVTIGLTIRRDTAPTPAAEPAFADWKDLATAVTTLIDGARRATLAACDAKARTVRVVVDRTARATRVWLPAWQFHSPTGDGSTPTAEKRVKACLTKAIRDWKAPAMPAALGEIHLALPV
ncbi:MAG: hypothetical protein ABI175_28030, partial [Polyangiales bacterium]